MRRPTINHIENALHTGVWQALQTLLPDDCLAWSVENRSCGVREGRRRKARGCVAGVPDLHVLHRGRLLLIELKAPRGALSNEQRGFLSNARACGAPTAVCRSIDDVIAFLKEQGVRLKGAVQ